MSILNEIIPTKLLYCLIVTHRPPLLLKHLTPNDQYMGRTALLTSRRCILYHHNNLPILCEIMWLQDFSFTYHVAA